MFKVGFAVVEDCESLHNCLIRTFESLREWLPASFVDPELKSMLEPEDIKKLRERIENKSEIFLIAVENHQIVGMALGREAGGVCSLGPKPYPQSDGFPQQLEKSRSCFLFSP